MRRKLPQTVQSYIVRGLENNPKIETRKDGTNQWKKSN